MQFSRCVSQHAVILHVEGTAGVQAMINAKNVSMKCICCFRIESYIANQPECASKLILKFICVCYSDKNSVCASVPRPLFWDRTQWVLPYRVCWRLHWAKGHWLLCKCWRCRLYAVIYYQRAKHFLNTLFCDTGLSACQSLRCLCPSLPLASGVQQTDLSAGAQFWSHVPIWFDLRSQMSWYVITQSAHLMAKNQKRSLKRINGFI